MTSSKKLPYKVVCNSEDHDLLYVYASIEVPVVSGDNGEKSFGRLIITSTGEGADGNKVDFLLRLGSGDDFKFFRSPDRDFFDYVFHLIENGSEKKLNFNIELQTKPDFRNWALVLGHESNDWSNRNNEIIIFEWIACFIALNFNLKIDLENKDVVYLVTSDVCYLDDCYYEFVPD